MRMGQRVLVTKVVLPLARSQLAYAMIAVARKAGPSKECQGNDSVSEKIINYLVEGDPKHQCKQ